MAAVLNTKSGPSKLFMVVWDDPCGVIVPMGFDRDCAGALRGICGNDKAALFQDRPAARRAINISRKFAELCKAQGKPANDDFMSAHGNIRIVGCELYV